MPISVLGTAQVQAALLRAAAVAQAGTVVAVRDISEEIAETMRGMVPVDTGELQDSIEAVEGGVEVGTDHWQFPEFGTYKMPAEPYIRPAADETDGEDQLQALARTIMAVS